MGRVAAKASWTDRERSEWAAPKGRAKRVNPPLTAIFEKELVRKYGLFFRMLHAYGRMPPVTKLSHRHAIRDLCRQAQRFRRKRSINADAQLPDDPSLYRFTTAVHQL